MEDSVKHFLDENLPLSNIIEFPERITDLKSQVVDASLVTASRNFKIAHEEMAP